MATATRVIGATGVVNEAMTAYQQSSSCTTEQAPVSQFGQSKSQFAATRTHRCRLYRTVQDIVPGEHLYTEVWDSLDRQEDVSGLPAGSELVVAFEDHSSTIVRQKLDAFRRAHGFRWRGNWKLRGSL